MTEAQEKTSKLQSALSEIVRPGCTGPEAMGSHANGEDLCKFPVGVELTQLEKRMLLAEEVRQGVLMMLRFHIYRFGGKFFSPESGWSHSL